MMVSFVLSFFPRDVLDEILNLIESVSEDFPSYSYIKTAYYREVWIYKNANYPTLNNLIRDFDWNSVINDTLSVDEACESFTTIFS